jgi:putative cardiolipin synthase
MRFFLGFFFLVFSMTLSAETATKIKRVMLSNDNVEAAAIRRDLARGAKNSIYASMYMLKMDRAGLNTLAELRDAALRGVEVHFMLDALYFRKVPAEIREALLSAGVHLYEYNPFDWRHPLEYFKRSHDKVWVFDEEWIDVSDRNVANEYHGLTRAPSISRGVMAQDKASARDAIQYMKESFVLPMVRKHEAKGNKKIAEAGAALLKRAQNNSITNYLAPYKDWRKKLRKLDQIQFNHTGVNSRDSPLGLDAALLEDLKKAKRKIVIENPYILLVPEYADVLADRLQNGVIVEAYTNSKFSGDNIFVSAAWEDSRDFLAAHGAEIWEHPGDQRVRRGWKEVKERLKRFRDFKIDRLTRSRNFLHSKVVVIDDHISHVSTFNLDPRSKNLNREVSMRIVSEDFARELKYSVYNDSKRLKYMNVARDHTLHYNAPTCGDLLRYIVRTPFIWNQL